ISTSIVMYKSFTEMPVWKEAMDLAVEIFKLTVNLPKSEDYSLTSQIRRSSNSVHANIAEGFGRNTSKDKARFYIISRGSATETQSHLIYGERVGYFNSINEIFNRYEKLIHSLNKLIKSLGG
ncbi:MAG: four helix bundle protein, partial [Bacteroidales bacterium]|nr:four helix bundle protein [Bacteroidales bacterium]